MRFVEQAAFDADVIVVDDGSQDATADIALRVAEEHPVIRLIQHGANLGKGMAVRTGLLAAEGDWALFTDVDEAVSIGQASRMLQTAVDQEADVAIGTRYHKDSVIVKRQPWQRVAVSRLGNLLIQALLLPGLKDTQCGFKLFRMETMRAVAERITVPGFGVDLEILAIARSWHRKIIEVPVTWIDGEGSTVHLALTAKNVLMDLLRITLRIRRGFYGSGDVERW